MRCRSLCLALVAAAGACGPGLFDADGRPDIRSIGPGGGELRSRDGRLLLTVPAGALDSAVTIFVEAEAVPGAIGLGYRIAPVGTTFAVPARISIEGAPHPDYRAPPVVARLEGPDLVPLDPPGATSRLGVFAATARCEAREDCVRGDCTDGTCPAASCSGDGECAPGLSCLDGGCGCRASCASDADCPGGAICAGEPCAGCVPCEPGTLACGGACLPEGAANCGGCGVRCGVGERCEAGACRACAAQETCDNGADDDCDGAVDEGCSLPCTGDADCASGEVCAAGACVPGCPAGTLGCGGACVPEDERNCGGCGVACATGERCVQAACAADPACDGDGDRFAAAGPACGGADCDDADPYVNPGAQEACDGRDDDCDGAVDEGCPVRCQADGECAAGELCLSGVCQPGNACPAGTVACNGACVDLSSDPASCGACGNACGTGQACAGGACQDGCGPAELCGNGLDDDCDGAVDEGCQTGCWSDAECAAGELCQNGVCQPGSGCPAGALACGGACVDPLTDPANCGACGAACGTGQMCAYGACQSSCGQAELCGNGVDDDCDGVVDEGCPVRCQTAAECPAGQTCQNGFCW